MKKIVLQRYEKELGFLPISIGEQTRSIVKKKDFCLDSASVLGFLSFRASPHVDPTDIYFDISEGQLNFSHYLNCIAHTSNNKWFDISNFPSNAIIGILPPLNQGELIARQYIDHAIVFGPKLLLLVLPKSFHWEFNGYEISEKTPMLNVSPQYNFWIYKRIMQKLDFAVNSPVFYTNDEKQYSVTTAPISVYESLIFIWKNGNKYATYFSIKPNHAPYFPHSAFNFKLHQDIMDARLPDENCYKVYFFHPQNREWLSKCSKFLQNEMRKIKATNRTSWVNVIESLISEFIAFDHQEKE